MSAPGDPPETEQEPAAERNAPSGSGVPQELLSSQDGSISQVIPVGAPQEDPKRRRISYFMLFRLFVLAGFTAVATAGTLGRPAGLPTFYGAFVWTTLGAGFLLSLLLARMLPRVRDLDAFAWIQTAADVVFAAVVIQMTGGLLSGFTFLYLLAILGAAVMGTRAQVLATAGACALIFSVLSALQLADWVQPLTALGEAPRLPFSQVWPELARPLAAMAAVTALSSFLAVQLARSAHEVGSLRVLTENVLRSLGSGLVTLSSDDRVRYANPAALEILDLGPEAIGAPLAEILPGIDRLRARVPDMRERQELLYRRPDGREVRLGLTLSPLLDEAGAVVGSVLNFQDVTRIHELAERVRRSERLAALGELSASVAHEVRNPLAAISASAQLLDRAGRPPEERQICEVLVREAQRLDRLVSDLLAFTRPSPPSPVPLDLSRAAADVRQSFAADPASTDVRVELVNSDPSCPRAMADPSQISQVLWNLLRNAAQAMDGRGTIHVRIEPHGADAVRLVVEDEGPGIPEGELDRVFEPFFTKKPGGSGFGLAIAHRIVEAHGGTIRACNRPDGGARFEIVLPAATGPGALRT